MRKFAQKAGPQAIGRFIDKNTKAALVKRGFAQADILSKWASIVGPTLAGASSPERMSYGRSKTHEATLKVRVAPGFAPEFQQFEPLIIERINSFFGYKAVARLQLIQAPVKLQKSADKKPLPALNKDQEAWLDASLQSVSDPDLKDQLTRLGQKLVSKNALLNKQKTT
ncbi:DUF721 domain-containing protein [Sneathiella limimaris]|uniref:DUF721 domain-containing protein n=1 Tax=Sneathiella limimaris TaxID=1964213 RepID=UPI00146EDF90|nr:DciA family protein [Sneathiella limimaris]